MIQNFEILKAKALAIFSRLWPLVSIRPQVLINYYEGFYKDDPDMQGAIITALNEWINNPV